MASASWPRAPRPPSPVVLVNQRPVAVNPVTIMIIGNQKEIEKALKPIAERFAGAGKVLEFRRQAPVRLSAFTGATP